jgi:hypothetical protein
VTGGFDCILGNPPWERVKLQEQEFFAARDPEVAGAPNAAARTRAIKALQETNPTLYEAFEAAKRASEAESLSLRKSGRFPLTGRGDVNTYSVFAELMARGVGKRGRAGIIVPTGIATDDTNKGFFGWLVDSGRLAALFDFENRGRLFPAVDSRMKFSLLTVAGDERLAAPFDVAFFLTQPDQLRESHRIFSIDAQEIALVNPQSRLCPIVRTPRDFDLLNLLHARGVQLEESEWNGYYIRLIHLGDHSEAVRFEEQIAETQHSLGRYARLYEAKLFSHYDHRFATFDGVPTESIYKGQARETMPSEHENPDWLTKPRYWVQEEFFRAIISKYPSQGGWLLTYRDICRSTDERTCIVSAIPETPATVSMPCLGIAPGMPKAMLQANLSTLCLDYAARLKVPGTHLTYGIMKQLPILSPSVYTQELRDLLTPRVLELVYTAHDLAPFARDCGYDGPPFTWDEERRAQLRADLDGIYAHLYGLSRDDFAYILDTFPIVARKDEAKWGEYRTKRLCLEAYDRFAGVVGGAVESSGGRVVG